MRNPLPPFTSVSVRAVFTKRYLWVLFFLVIPAAFISKMLSATDRQNFLSMMSVRKAKVVRAAKEIERKCFHVAGVLVPIWYGSDVTRTRTHTRTRTRTRTHLLVDVRARYSYPRANRPHP